MNCPHAYRSTWNVLLQEREKLRSWPVLCKCKLGPASAVQRPCKLNEPSANHKQAAASGENSWSSTRNQNDTWEWKLWFVSILEHHIFGVKAEKKQKLRTWTQFQEKNVCSKVRCCISRRGIAGWSSELCGCSFSLLLLHTEGRGFESGWDSHSHSRDTGLVPPAVTPEQLILWARDLWFVIFKKAEFDRLVWMASRTVPLLGRGGEDSAGDSIDRHLSQLLRRLKSQFTGERMRFEEGVSLSGSLDPNWGCQGWGVYGESKHNRIKM